MRGSRGGHVWWLYGILALQGVLGAMTGDRACGDVSDRSHHCYKETGSPARTVIDQADLLRAGDA